MYLFVLLRIGLLITSFAFFLWALCLASVFGSRLLWSLFGWIEEHVFTCGWCIGDHFLFCSSNVGFSFQSYACGLKIELPKYFLLDRGGIVTWLQCKFDLALQSFLKLKKKRLGLGFVRLGRPCLCFGLFWLVDEGGPLECADDTDARQRFRSRGCG